MKGMCDECVVFSNQNDLVRLEYFHVRAQCCVLGLSISMQ